MLRKLCTYTTSLLKLYIILREFASKIFNLRERIVFTLMRVQTESLRYKTWVILLSGPHCWR